MSEESRPSVKSVTEVPLAEDVLNDVLQGILRISYLSEAAVAKSLQADE